MYFTAQLACDKRRRVSVFIISMQMLQDNASFLIISECAAAYGSYYLLWLFGVDSVRMDDYVIYGVYIKTKLLGNGQTE